MRRLLAALIALLGLVMAAGSLNLMLVPISVVFADLPLGLSAVAIGLSLVPAIASIAFAVFLIRRRERVAAWYLKDEDDALAIPAESLLRVGLVLLGIYLIVQALPELLATATSPVVNWLQLKADTIFGEPYADQSAWRWLIQSIPKIAANLASLAIGILLLLKRERIVARVLGGGAAAGDASGGALALCPTCGAAYDPAEYDGGVAEPRCTTCKAPLNLPSTVGKGSSTWGV